ncbi:uncharacterized protein ATC70_011738 [Mucor velutinosus]|uniref:JmjC domain-containing protein n=1 Tax=Mucor velutinosus TaxID=708070 RepID=A0AAN7DIV4_9FUNG|nr:hypothetical protein ATC70_011738 [Mucor velutinosus]
MTMQMNTSMGMNMDAGGRNIMPETDILSDENNLPAQFVAATRISMKNFMDKPNEFRNMVQTYCIKKGKPLVISDMNTLPGWDDGTFSLDQLKAYRGDENAALDFPDAVKRDVVLGKFIEKLQQENHLERDHSYPMLKNSTQKVYAKDITCPTEYTAALEKIVPDYLLPHGPDDLFSILPQRFRAENLMCYLGQDNTGTPIHRDLCGTMGHNLMTMGDADSFAEWIIIESDHRDELAGILRPSQTENLVADLSSPPKHTKSSFMESDRAWLHNAMLEHAQFQAQVIVQRPGDLVIIPSRAYHQVRNVGISVKIAWNRITAQTLQYAFDDQIPLYHTINRPEVYKCKAIVALTIQHWNEQLKKMKNKKGKRTQFSESYGLHTYNSKKAFFDSSLTLLALFLIELIEPEMLYQTHKIVTDEKDEVFTVRCDFCYGDIFHRYYHCDACNDYDLCLNCYSMGRSCEHAAEMKMHQSPKKLTNYINLYKEYVQNLNEVLGSRFTYFCEENKEDRILNLKPSEASNLATTCVRLERFRKKYQNQHHTLRCQHCNATTTVNELGNQGISLSSVFQQSPCSNVATKKRPYVDVYTCNACTNTCDKCEPLESNNGSLKDYNLVYYLPASHDSRNRGSFMDFNIAKSYDVADDPVSSTKRKRPEEDQDYQPENRRAKRMSR